MGETPRRASGLQTHDRGILSGLQVVKGDGARGLAPALLQAASLSSPGTHVLLEALRPCAPPPRFL